MSLKSLLSRSSRATLASLESFSALLADTAATVSPKHTHAIDCGGDVPLEARVFRRAEARIGAPLVVLFCGAIDQTKRTLPVFQQLELDEVLLDGGAIITIADPSLRCSTELKTAYYQGDHECPTPDLVKRLIDAAVASTETERLILAGNSAGAHAALLHAAPRPKSVAVVAGIISSMSNHWPTMIETYRAACWPDVEPDDLSSVVHLDTTTLYQTAPHGVVVCLQNATDQHMCKQVGPLVTAMRDRKKMLLVAECLPGMRGHRYDKNRWADWVTSAALADEGDIESIVSTYESRYQTTTDGPAATPARSPGHTGVPEEAMLADRIAEHLRQQGSSS